MMKRFLIGSVIGLMGLLAGGSVMAMPADVPAASMSASEQTLTPSQINEVIASLREELPQDLDTGITWTDIALTDNNTYLQLTIKISQAAFEGVSAADMRDTFKNMSRSELQGYLGEEFMSLSSLFGKKLSLKILLSGQQPLVVRVN